MPTILGHKNKQGIRSIIAQAANIQLAPEPPVQETCTKITPLLHLICADQTGWFLVRSKSGNNHIIILCDYDANTIIGEPMPDRKSTAL